MPPLDDHEIVEALLRRDQLITSRFLYGKCLPLFTAIHAKYYTDCDTPVELINEIYAYILYPAKQTGRSKLQDFGFRCSLTVWLKVVTENYCHQLFGRRIPDSEIFTIDNDRFLPCDDSLIVTDPRLDSADVGRILEAMPSERYRTLIRLRYLQGKTNEETAAEMGMTMANYYNCHKRAKDQYCETLRKEGLT